jgi:hypothetical protein
VQDTVLVPTIRLRRKSEETLRELFNSRTNAELAPRFGLGESQLSRLQRGRSDVYPLFLARLLLALEAEGETASDLIEVLDTDGSTLRIHMTWERIKPHCQTCSQVRSQRAS